MLNENVVNLLKEQFWYLGTCDGNMPNVIPVAFKDVTEDGKLIVGDVFLKTTLQNIQKNGNIAVSVGNGMTLEGYQIKGKAEYLEQGDIVEKFKIIVEDMFHGAATAKGALVITPEKVIVTTPGDNNNKEL
ncbi:pyridoxamine 5'-phosphate oxidase family protein [Negativibacillus massiliensis]|uniref:pyridoxamine 5'-phosphate oxidase family protein n=1 Tax=Negativibacillus massiliensis TaxID=1871035 RepID=UPI003AF566AB